MTFGPGDDSVDRETMRVDGFNYSFHVDPCATLGQLVVLTRDGYGDDPPYEQQAIMTRHGDELVVQWRHEWWGDETLETLRREIESYLRDRDRVVAECGVAARIGTTAPRALARVTAAATYAVTLYADAGVYPVVIVRVPSDASEHGGELVAVATVKPSGLALDWTAPHLTPAAAEAVRVAVEQQLTSLLRDPRHAE